MSKILIVEDDMELAETLKRFLQSERCTADHAPCASDGDYRARNYPYDLIILDWELPDGSGVELCDGWRRAGLNFPVLMLTGRSTVPDKVKGLDYGADDYLSKPFEKEELLARMRALLKRAFGKLDDTKIYGRLKVSPSAHSLEVAGQPVALTGRDFDVLMFLLERANDFCTTEQILLRIWGGSDTVQPSAVFSAIKRLRKAIPQNAASIEHSAGLGYRLCLE